MKILKFALIFCFCVAGAGLRAQDKNDVLLFKPNRGLISFGATIAPSFQLRNSIRNYYVNGYLEYFPSRNISLRGDVYGLLTSTPASPRVLQHNHVVLFGGYYHFQRMNWDFFVGMEPGAGLVQGRFEDGSGNWASSPLKVVPYISFMGGTRYYVGDFFNFFAEFRYLQGKYFGRSVLYLDAVSISAGLGFNIGLFSR